MSLSVDPSISLSAVDDPCNSGKVGKVERVICLDASSEEHYSYARLMSDADQDKHLVPAMSNLSPNHISIVIYTSGQYVVNGGRAEYVCTVGV